MSVFRTFSSSDLLSEFMETPADTGASLWWLGQAGFLIRFETFRLAIDPYLSDSLSRKYAGAKFPHVRMMQPPLLGSDLHGLDAILCTHRHTDHMDQETLTAILAVNAACRFVLPAAEEQRARDINLPTKRCLFLDAGERLPLSDGVEVEAIAAAHEDLKRDDRGRHQYLGYVISSGGVKIYHSGDCVPYAGLVSSVAAAKPDLALLPINGRDDTRRANGVPGNFSLSEAIELVGEAAVPFMIGHHFGLFEFNTTDPDAASAEIAQRGLRGQVTLAAIGRSYRISAT